MSRGLAEPRGPFNGFIERAVVGKQSTLPRIWTQTQWTTDSAEFLRKVREGDSPTLSPQEGIYTLAESQLNNSPNILLAPVIKPPN